MALIRVTVLLIATRRFLTQGLTLQPPSSKPVINIGVTSLLRQDDGNVFAGTKAGKIFRSVSPNNYSSWEEIPGYTTKFPFYSLASRKDIGNEQLLFCGGGDRFVSVWGASDGQFRYNERLGPHTGWVKDLAYDEDSQTLYSIGCNCIEIWDCSASPIVHLTKRSIENSPDMGSTLSSDLLCLCLLENGTLVSGGVDGRIHVWSSDSKIKQPLCSTACHNGRVNSLVLVSSMKTCFSLGNDGKVNALGISGDGFVLQSEYQYSIEGNPRLTCAVLVGQTNDGCKLAFGSADGQIILVNIGRLGDTFRFEEVDRIEFAEGPMIYALCTSDLPTNVILAGHAKGMEKVHVHS